MIESVSSWYICVHQKQENLTQFSLILCVSLLLSSKHLEFFSFHICPPNASWDNPPSISVNSSYSSLLLAIKQMGNLAWHYQAIPLRVTNVPTVGFCYLTV